MTTFTEYVGLILNFAPPLGAYDSYPVGRTKTFFISASGKPPSFFSALAQKTKPHLNYSVLI